MQRRQALTTLGAVLAATALPRAARAQSPQAALAGLLEARRRTRGVAYAAFEADASGVRLASVGPEGAVPAEGALFEIGSITKTFTALLLADAVQRGELALDDPVEAVLPAGLPLRDSASAPLRWRDLATHRSGLPRLAGNMLPRDQDDPYADYGWDSLRAFLRGWQPTRERDASFEYSNLGFGLLGQALAFRSGQPLAQLWGQRVLQPLGLADEVFVTDPPGRPRLAGHDGAGKPVPGWHFTEATAGAGTLRASARGLARYAQAALGQFDHPLKPAFALCLRRHAATAAPINPIGLAWLLAPLNGRTVFNHDGATAGFTSALWLDPARGRAAGVLSNAAVPVGDLALHLLDPAVPLPDEHATTQPATTLAPEALAPLAGRYALNAGFAVTIRADGARLFAQATGQGEFELFANAPRRWFARVTPLQISFDGETGVPPAFTLEQGGQKLRFVRER